MTMREAGQGDDDADGYSIEETRLAVISICERIKTLSRIDGSVNFRLDVNCGIAGPHGEFERPGISTSINYTVYGNIPNVSEAGQCLTEGFQHLAGQLRSF